MNVLDIMIKDDQNRPDGKKWTFNEIGENIALFQLASTDTSISVMKLMIVFLAQHPEVVSLIRDSYQRLEADENFKIEDIVNDPEIEALWSEMMRFLSASPFAYKVEFTKKTKIAGVKIRKGDRLRMYLPSSAKFRKKGDLAQFDHTRFLDARRKRIEEHNAMPFALGNRRCLG